MKYIILITLFGLASCHTELPEELLVSTAPLSVVADNSGSKKALDPAYWYSGKAEVSKYTLKQNRYREVHDGEVILIFVTEDFLTDKQVKNDNYVNKNSVSVLKTNQLRRFTTGLYDYSMMTSVFTRADGRGTEKVTLTSQDWCGHSFVQINKQGAAYRVQLRSYFESEGDEDKVVKADLLEDEIMNLLRIDPDLIPTGDVKMLPSLVYLRLSHGKMFAQKAIITKSDSGPHKMISINYPDDNRSISLTYESASPYRIISFLEKYPSAFDKTERTSEAVKVSELHDAYWKMNHASEKPMRDTLKISGF